MPLATSGEYFCNRTLGAVRGVYADIFGGEVASPIAGTRFSGVQIHYNRNVFGKQPVGSGAFVEIQRLAFAQNFDTGHGDFHQRRIELNAGTSSGRENSSPV